MNREPPCVGKKTCPTCGIPQTVLAFAVNPKTSDGLQHECRGCVSERGRRRYANTLKKRTIHNSFDRKGIT